MSSLNEDNDTQHVKKDAGKFSEWQYLTLAPLDSLRAVLRVFAGGQRKYSTLGFLLSAIERPEEAKYSRLVNAAIGHVLDWQLGSDVDEGEPGKPGSGENPLANAICSLLILLCWQIRGLGVDDRSKLSPEERKKIGRFVR